MYIIMVLLNFPLLFICYFIDLFICILILYRFFLVDKYHGWEREGGGGGGVLGRYGVRVRVLFFHILLGYFTVVFMMFIVAII